MGKTAIEWATHTDNYQAGCSKVSPACEHCYAIPQSARIEKMDGPERYNGIAIVETGREPRWTGRVVADLDAMDRIFVGMANAKSSRRTFINSMTDTFHESVPEHVFARLAWNLSRKELAGHVVMLLTKRASRLLAFQRRYYPDGLPPWVWVGCTVEDQRRAEERVPDLLQVHAIVRFVSMEPLLGAVNLTNIAVPGGWTHAMGGMHGECVGGPMINWVIAGGESGPKARPTHPIWARSLRDQCSAADVSFLWKQWGEWAPISEIVDSDTLYEPHDPENPTRTRRCRVPELILRADGAHKQIGHPESFRSDLPGWPSMHAFRIGKKAAGRTLDGVAHDGLPNV